MNHSVITDDREDAVLARFLHELQSAGDRDAVVDEFCKRYPEMADELQSLATMDRRMHEVSPLAAPLPTRRLQPGHALGPFVIRRLIASGGMGEVYEAMQTSLNRRVAVKIIRRGRIDPTARDRFRREQLMLAKLHQTHIVPIFADGEDGEVQYFAMAYIDGAPLNRVVDTAYSRETSHPQGKTPSLRHLAESRIAPAENGESVGEQSTSPFPAQRSAPSKDTERQFHLSPAYFRSVAEVMAQAAEAIQYAHDVTVYHRDIKPSNLMVDRHGHCWIIDFGLAGMLPDADASPTTDGELANSFTQGAIGTPQYMAPEQHRGQPESRSDVWGLGATLYELLTLRRAFDGNSRETIAEMVDRDEPKPIRHMVPAVPADLDAICRKAMRKSAHHRYASPGEFGADLQRWLNHEATIARPARAPRRMALWARRNPGWAAAVALSLLTLAGFAVAKVQHSQRLADVASVEALAAQAAQRHSVKLAEAAQRTTDILQLQTLRRDPNRQNGWSTEVLNGAQKLVDLADRRDFAAATFIGLDGVLERDHDDLYDTSSVLFFPDGKRLLIGGQSHFDGAKETLSPGLIWSGNAVDQPTPTGQSGRCRLAMAPDGTPLQLLYPSRARKTLLLWDAQKQAALREFAVPHDATVFDVALSADGSLVGLSFRTDKDAPNGGVRIWNSESGALVRQSERPAQALAFSPDNKFVALCSFENDTTIWPVAGGDALFTLPAERNAIKCLTFGESPLKSNRPQHFGESRWLLAAGMHGGEAVIWDLDLRTVMTRCLGAMFDVYTMAFSPDRTTLAVAGRSPAKLFDVASGRPLLDLNRSNILYSVAFSPDGHRLAISGRSWVGPNGFAVWRVESGRSIDSLRGLRGPIGKVIISADGRTVAAVSQNWEVGVWRSGQGLLHKFAIPSGLVADNTALAFSHDAKKIAHSGADQAIEWDVESGRQLNAWKLPPAIHNLLAYDGDRLISMRTETEDGKVMPVSTAHPVAHPRVHQLRELRPNGKTTNIKTITDHNWHLTGAVSTSEAKYFVCEGMIGKDRPTRQTINAYDIMGNRIWSIEQPSIVDRSVLTIDPLGNWLAFEQNAAKNQRPSIILVELPTGRHVKTLELHPIAITADGKSQLHHAPSKFGGFALSYFREGQSGTMLTLGIDQKLTTIRPQFTPNGSHAAWGNGDGTVTLADMNEVLRRLEGLK